MRAALAVALCSGVLAAQSPTVVTVGPAGNPIREGTPRFTVTTSGFTPAQLPLQLNLEVSLTADFTSLWADTTVNGSSATIVIPRLLPQNTPIWWRSIARTAQGSPVVENAIGPRQTSEWVTLEFPNDRAGNTLTTTRPTFRWRAVEIHPPIEPWRYRFYVTRTNDGVHALIHTPLFDSVYTSPVELESNTSYYWKLDAIAGTGDSITVRSNASFVILSPNAPSATVLFQPFPNPFPNDVVSKSCIWFDIKSVTDVRLDVRDLRGNHVKRIFPSAELQTFAPGRYGRETFGSPTGCDQRFTWDGTDARGRMVSAGVYLIVFEAGGVRTVKRVLFRGR
jgi:hypothetical protein